MHLFVVANFVMACCWKVPRLPALGETLSATDLSIEPGGKGLNVAVAARRLGVTVDALFGVGNDAAADSLPALLTIEGISADYVQRFPQPSAHGVGLINADGGNAIAVYLGPNLLLDAGHAELAAAAIRRADWLYGQFETSLAVLLRCFQIARQHSATTVLNPSPWQSIPPALLALTDVLLVNEIEVAALLKLPAALSGGLNACLAILEAAVADFWAGWPGQLLIVTLGEQGSLALRRDQPALPAPAFSVAALDSIGAGDAFAAGLLKMLGQQADLADALQYANACGAIVAANRGVLTALPDAAAVDRFLAVQQR